MAIVAQAVSSSIPLDCVTSVCTLRDLDTWLVVCAHLSERIAAKRYRVIVPNDQVAKFREQTPIAFEVHAEGDYVGDLAKELLNRLRQANQNRMGWYLQQFVKLASLIQAKTRESHLIWDSDTVPLRKLGFVSVTGKLIYYKGFERHPAYFHAIERLLGMDNTLPFSFIAQCLPCKTEWAQAFASDLERRFKLPWAQAILNTIDFSEVSGFSEYETLGTFIQAHYPDQIQLVDTPWFRYGGTLLGKPENMNRAPYSWLLKRYDFISLESWDRDLRLPRFFNFMNAIRKELMTKGSL